MRGPALRRLDFAGNDFCGVAGQLELGLAVKANSVLEVLVLAYNNMYTDNLRQLARALVDNKCLRTLSVRGNKIGDDGARLFARGLRANDTLQQLDLGDNGLGEAAARELANAARLNMTVRAARRARAGEATAGELTRPRAHPARAAARAGVGGQPAHRRRGAAAAGCGAQQAPRAVRLGLGSHRLVLLARCC